MNLMSGRHIAGRYIAAGKATSAVAVIVTPSSALQDHGYAVKVYDRSGQRLAIYGSDIGDNPITEIEFELLDTGCGEFALTFGRKPDIELTYNHRIDIHLCGDPQPWYSGYIIKKPLPGKTEPTWTYEGFGFYQQLEYVVVNQTYEASDLGAITRDIITGVVEPKTDIVYRGTKIVNTGFTATKLPFEYVTAKEAISKLVEFATNYVAGVDEYREFFYKPIPTEINEDSRHWIGWHVHEFDPEEDLDSVVNHIFVAGGTLDTTGTNILYECSDATSIAAYGLRQQILQIPTALAEADATRWGDNQLQKLKTPQPTAEANHIEINKRKIKAEGKARVTTNDGKVVYEMPIKRVKYNISADGMICSMDLGDVPEGQDKYITELVRRARDNEILQSLINKQLSGVTV